MTTDIFGGMTEAEYRTERAMRAVKAFRAMQPGLTGYAQALTGRRDVTVQLAKGTPRTDGKKIFFKPPIELGDTTPHVRSWCERRDSVSQIQLCPACRTREEVLITIIHEIGHIAFGTFQEVADSEKKKAIDRAVAQAPSKFAARVRNSLESAPPEVSGSYMSLSQFISPFLPVLINSLEDARVDTAMHKARKGTKVMFDAYVQSVFSNGIPQDNGDTLFWKDRPFNSQVLIGVFIIACKYSFEGWFAPEVEKALKDQKLTEIVRQIDTARSAFATYQMSFQVLERLRQLGFCQGPEDTPEDEEPPQEEENENEDQHSEEGSSGEEEEPDQEAEGGESSSDDGDSGGDDADEDAGEDASDGGVESSSSEGDGTEAGAGEGPDEESSDSDEADGAESGSESSEQSSESSSGGNDEEAEGDDERGGSEESDRSEGSSSEGSDTAESDESGSESGDSSGERDSDSEGSEGSSDDTGDSADASGDRASGSDESDAEGSGEVPSDLDGHSDSGNSSGDSDGAGSGMASEPGSTGEGEVPSGPLEPEDEARGDSDGPDGEPEQADDSTRADVEDDRDADPFDSGADEGEGGVTDKSMYGTADEAKADVEVFGKHEAVVAPSANSDEAEDDHAVEQAIIQGLYFEKPSANVNGVRIHRHGVVQYDDAGKKIRSRAWSDNVSEYLKKRHGISADTSIPESVLGPALLHMRRVFSDNARAKHQLHLKSGKINGKVLGKRAPLNDPRLFGKKRLPGKKSYKVILGLDISGSTSGLNITLIKRAAMAQAELLHRAGIDFAIYAHTASGKSIYSYDLWLDIYVIKEFDQSWDQKAKDALESIGADQENIDGHTIEFYRKIIEKENATDKIILYYTDGKMPAANADEELVILQREIAYCKKNNITLMGVGIRTDSPKRHGLDTVQVDTDADLPKVVTHLEKALVRNR